MAGDASLVLRLSGSAPALGLAVEGETLGTLGEGPSPFPPPPGSTERDWDRIPPEAFEAAVAAARADGRSLVRAVLAACPGPGHLVDRGDGGTAVVSIGCRGNGAGTDDSDQRRGATTPTETGQGVPS